MLFPEKEFFTVSELNGAIREVLTNGFLNAVWVCGEIQGYDRNRDKKHIFFELCEKNSVTKEVAARIGLVIFSGKRAVIEETLAAAQNAFQLKDDIEVKFLCRVDFYPPHGAVRLVVESIDPVYTLGKIAQERQRLIALLKQQGVLDKNKALPLPEVPLRIGLITAYDSAAYNDFISELKSSGFGFEVFCRNTVMQGKNAENDVCRAIQYFQGQEVDVLVITRGGGSIAELSCFDSQRIAECVATSRIPVLSGIGHEINITVTDLAAHTHQKTPTAVARFLIERVESFLTGMEEKGYQLVLAVRERLETRRRQLKDLAVDFQTGTVRFLKGHEQKIAYVAERLIREPQKVLMMSLQEMERFYADLKKMFEQRMRTARQRVAQYEAMAGLADPVHTLRRGFSITRTKDGKIIKGVGGIHLGEDIVTDLRDGQVTSQVQKIKKEESGGRG